jgi:hypothetical protein
MLVHQRVKAVIEARGHPSPLIMVDSRCFWSFENDLKSQKEISVSASLEQRGD